MAWANLDIEPGLPDHPKIIQLEAEVGEAALAYMLRLWCWAALNAPNGELKKFSNINFLERRVMRWAGAEGQLLEAMHRAGLLDVTGNSVVIHNFKSRNAHLTKYKDHQRKAANARWAKYRAKKGADGQSTL